MGPGCLLGPITERQCLPVALTRRRNMKGQTMKPHFQFASSYMNTVEYECSDSTGCYRLKLRVGVSDYERSIYNGTREDYERECAAVTGYLTAIGGRRVPLATVAAFNDWQKKKNRLSNSRFDADPERYGFISADDPIRQPTLAKGAAHWDDGWKFTYLCCVIAA